MGKAGTRKIGSGAAVTLVQQALADLEGASENDRYLAADNVTGVYDQATWDAVKRLKRDKGLGWETMGDVGPGTMRWLDAHFGLDARKREFYFKLYDIALQGLAGRTELSVRRRADLAGEIAEQATPLVEGSTRSDWNLRFQSALQTTAGGEYSAASVPVRRAAEIADQAVLVTRPRADGAANQSRCRAVLPALRRRAAGHGRPAGPDRRAARRAGG